MTETVTERERWEAERHDAGLELSLKEREFALKEKESLRQNRQAAWKNPLVIAIMTAALAAGSNALVSYISAEQQHQLEALKAESARILEMIKTDDTEQAARNLAFLIDTGLVANTSIRTKLGKFLDTRSPDNSPSLPGAVPSRPAFLTQAEKEQLLGGPEVHAGTDRQISLDDPWIQSNIIEVDIPQLTRIGRPISSGRIRFHKAAAPALKRVFEEIEQAGLLGDVLTMDGSFAPRTIRGSLNHLSSHALGIAVDLNAEWNSFGAAPAPADDKGTLLRIAPIFEKHGFVWGAKGIRPDGMHFEFADRDALAQAR